MYLILQTSYSCILAQVITFIDLAGHEKYLKTTIFGMTGHVPDFAMLMVGSNAGIIGMTKGRDRICRTVEQYFLLSLPSFLHPSFLPLPSFFSSIFPSSHLPPSFLLSSSCFLASLIFS